MRCAIVALLASAPPVLALACGGGTPAVESPAAPAPDPVSTATAPPPEPEAPPVATAEPEPPAGPKGWKDMGREERITYMKETVTPRMMALFQEHDPKEFESFTCATCHGPGVKEGKFTMPNPTLYRLLPYAQELKKHPKDVKFMEEKVVPVMAELLGASRYDPATRQGFGCYGCHTPK